MSSAAEGWYVDPSTGTNLRFWDGSTWTEHVAPLPDETPRASPIDLLAALAAAESAAEAAAESAIASVAAPVADPIPDPVAQPVAERVAEPLFEPVAEPVAEPVTGRHAGAVAAPPLEPELEHTQLTRRELRARRGGNPDLNDAPKHLPPMVPPAADLIDRSPQPEKELEIPDASAGEPGSDTPEEPRQRPRRALRLSVLLGILTVASSIAVLTAGSL
ncbi:MAG: DUF2510 domain-containing protein [Homoserinimonas sp.]